LSLFFLLSKVLLIIHMRVIASLTFAV